MYLKSLKIIGFSALALAFTTGSALAGNGKDCDHKNKTAIKSEASAVAAPTQTSVLSTSTASAKAKAVKKTYSFEDAMALCQKKGAGNLQACIDYKTGKTKPQS